MSKAVWIALAGLAAATWWLVCAASSDGAGLTLATDAPKASPPEESIRRFRLPEGFRMELVASEPHLADPVAMAFDAQGRIIVCEIHGYNLEGYLDVRKLNEQGVLDTAVRRIPANPQAIEHAEREQYGTVKLLEDTDGDGRMDHSTILADRLPPCYGVVPARDGVIVLCAPEIVYLADRDGDGKAEVRKTLFSGFGVGELWTRINNPRWGLDNWIYAVSGGGSGGTIRGPNLPTEVSMGAVCFRFKADGSALQPATGNTHGFGQAIDDFGDRFLCTNQQHALYVAPLPHRYLTRNPFYAAPGLVVNISTYGHPARVYPASRPHPWRWARSKDPAWVKFYGAAEATANGYFTAASGQAIYEARQFPAEYRGNHFSVDNAQNLVHRCLLVAEGTGYTATRPRKDEKVEFLTSTEQWFRPTNLMTGPDGSLYVVDMYREIIEDYSAIPRYLQQLYIRSLIAGAEGGRIWRVVADGTPGPRPFDLAAASTARLVGELENGNGWWRRTAQRLLVERGDPTAVGPLERLAREGKTPQARLHALYALDGLDSLDPGVVERALGDPHFAVRVHALRLAERWLDQRPELMRKVLAMAPQPHPRVRLQLALTLGQSEDRRAAQALAGLAASGGADRWIRAAILSSAAGSADRMLGEIVRQGDDPRQARLLVHPLASVVGARHDNQEIGNLLTAIGQAQGEESSPLQVKCLQGLIEGLKRGNPKSLDSPAGEIGLRRLLGSPAVKVRELALQVAGLLRIERAPEIKAAFTAARQIAVDDTQDVQRRQAAIGLLAAAPYDEMAPAMEELLSPRQAPELQLAAVKASSSSDDPRVGSLLLANFNGYTPQVQDAVIEAVFGRQNRLPKLLDAVEQGVVRPAGLDALRRLLLLENPDPQISRRAKLLMSAGAATKSRQPVVARYLAALSLSRQPKRGKDVFDRLCSKCHRLQGEGSEVGPDLAAANRRSDETLVADVMDPSSQITVGYNNYVVITQAGQIFTGVLAAETATSITLRREEQAEDTILRRNIDEMEASPASMMPENLEEEVSPQDVVDMIAFLRESLVPVPPPLVTLFEDEQSFVQLLAGGAGTVGLRTDDRFSGTASLAVTPPQRFSLDIPGWKYRIVENPGKGEFRYLRFAWKSPGGEGVMLELAADGQWPPAEQPLRRYYSGRNTTGWAAVRVAQQAPRQWTVVTRDLWKDFGEFTLTGIAPTAMGSAALFDRIELLRSLDDVKPSQ